MGEFAETLEETWESDAMSAGALEGFDDDAGYFVGVFLENVFDDGEAFVGGGLVL